MSYQGARAQVEADESRHVFAVSQVRLGADGHIAEVLWAEWNPKSNLAVGEAVLRSVADVVDALHDGAQVLALFGRPGRPLPDRGFIVLEHADGRETIALAGPPSAEREIGDIVKIGAATAKSTQAVSTAPTTAPSAALPPSAAQPTPQARVGRRSTVSRVKPVFAVSKVRLDADGRVTAVRWGRVDSRANAWATPEVQAPVLEVVQAIQAGDPVYALFPTPHGHMPARRFEVVDYDDGWQTIVLEGPSLPEREIHDMDRFAG
jgi:hypothetical protein